MLKSQCIVALYGKYTVALTFENALNTCDVKAVQC
jgi:hypothetical protein